MIVKNTLQKNTSASLVARFRSLRHALSGFRQLLLREMNARIQLLAALSVILLGLVRHIPRGSWIAIVFAIAMVGMAEAFNTAIELTCDFICRGRYHPMIKLIKDISAAAVLIAAAAAVCIAAFVFTI